MTKTKSTFLVLLAVLLSPMAAQAAIIDVTATFDGRIRDVNGVSFGPVLEGGQTLLEAYLDPGGFDTRIVMEFDVSAILGSIASANILFPGGATSPNTVLASQLDVFAYAGNGSLELADAFAGLLAGSFAPSTTGPNTISLDTAVLQALLDGGATYFGLVILTPNPGQAVWSDTNNTTLRFDVVAVPEPGTLALLGIGLLGLGLSRRKKV